MAWGGGSVWGCWELCPVQKGLEEHVVPSQAGINQPGLVLTQTTGRTGSRAGAACCARGPAMLVQGLSAQEVICGLDHGV